MGESRNAYRVLVGKPEGKRPLGRPRRRWEDSIKMDLREMGFDRDWINLAQNRDRWRAYVRAAMNLRVPYKKRTLVSLTDDYTIRRKHQEVSAIAFRLINYYVTGQLRSVQCASFYTIPVHAHVSPAAFPPYLSPCTQVEKLVRRSSEKKLNLVVVITEGVSLTCEHDPKLQEYCVCPQNMPQFDSEGIPNQAPETNKPMILNGPTSRNRKGSDQ
ncbi:hypothetical protein ANN_02267, partial [Periplaneta americana]